MSYDVFHVRMRWADTLEAHANEVRAEAFAAVGLADLAAGYTRLAATLRRVAEQSPCNEVVVGETNGFLVKALASDGGEP